MDLFYRFEPNFLRPGPPTANEGAKALSSYASRLSFSVLAATQYMPTEGAEYLLSILNAGTLFVVCLTLAGWALASIVGGPLGIVVNALLAIYGIWQIWSDIKELKDELKEWLALSYSANNEADLEAAGKSFARATVHGVLTLLQGIVTHKVFAYARRKLAKRYPPPPDLETQYQRRVNEVAERRKEAKRKIKKVAETVVDVAKERATTHPPPPDSSWSIPALVAGSVLVGGGLVIAVRSLMRADAEDQQ